LNELFDFGNVNASKPSLRV